MKIYLIFIYLFVFSYSCTLTVDPKVVEKNYINRIVKNWDGIIVIHEDSGKPFSIRNYPQVLENSFKNNNSVILGAVKNNYYFYYDKDKNKVSKNNIISECEFTIEIKSDQVSKISVPSIKISNINYVRIADPSYNQYEIKGYRTFICNKNLSGYWDGREWLLKGNEVFMYSSTLDCRDLDLERIHRCGKLKVKDSYTLDRIVDFSYWEKDVSDWIDKVDKSKKEYAKLEKRINQIKNTENSLSDEEYIAKFFYKQNELLKIIKNYLFHEKNDSLCGEYKDTISFDEENKISCYRHDRLNENPIKSSVATWSLSKCYFAKINMEGQQYGENIIEIPAINIKIYNNDNIRVLLKNKRKFYDWGIDNVHEENIITAKGIICDYNVDNEGLHPLSLSYADGYKAFIDYQTIMKYQKIGYSDRKTRPIPWQINLIEKQNNELFVSMLKHIETLDNADRFLLRFSPELSVLQKERKCIKQDSFFTSKDSVNMLGEIYQNIENIIKSKNFKSSNTCKLFCMEELVLVDLLILKELQKKENKFNDNKWVQKQVNMIINNNYGWTDDFIIEGTKNPKILEGLLTIYSSAVQKCNDTESLNSIIYKIQSLYKKGVQNK